jgi:hypothetical protein
MRPRKIAHVAQRSNPTTSPKPRLATTPHACQSQSPAQVFTEVKARGDGNAEGSGVERLEEADVEADGDIDVEVDDIDDWLVVLVLDTPVLLVDVEDDEVDAAELELEVVGVAVVNPDLVVLTLVSVVQIATPSPFVVVVIVLSTVIPNSL